MLQIKNGAFQYQNHIGIHDINLKINCGDAVGIMGPNGSGKSTLLKVIVGLYPLSKGHYILEEKEINCEYLKDPQKAGELYKKIGLIFQNSEIQLFNTNVYDEIAFGPRHLGLASAEVARRTHDCLKLLEIERLQKRVPYHLSGGEQKLVAIASVLAMNPDIIVFDEPFNGLSAKYRMLVSKLIKQLHQTGKTIIISSHHFNQIRNLVDHLYIFSEKHTIIKDESITTLQKTPNFGEYLDNI